MANDLVELARRLYELFGKGDIPRVLELFDTHIEWREAEGHPYIPDGVPLTGPQEVLQKIFMRIGAGWDGFTITPHAFTAMDGGVLVEARYTGMYKPTGRAANIQVAHVWRARDGRFTHFQQYVDTAALQALMHSQRADAAAL